MDTVDVGLYLDQMNVASKPGWTFRMPNPARIDAFLSAVRDGDPSPPLLQARFVREFRASPGPVVPASRVERARVPA